MRRHVRCVRAVLIMALKKGHARRHVQASVMRCASTSSSEFCGGQASMRRRIRAGSLFSGFIVVEARERAVACGGNADASKIASLVTLESVRCQPLVYEQLAEVGDPFGGTRCLLCGVSDRLVAMLARCRPLTARDPLAAIRRPFGRMRSSCRRPSRQGQAPPGQLWRFRRWMFVGMPSTEFRQLLVLLIIRHVA